MTRRESRLEVGFSLNHFTPETKTRGNRFVFPEQFIHIIDFLESLHLKLFGGKFSDFNYNLALLGSKIFPKENLRVNACPILDHRRYRVYRELLRIKSYPAIFSRVLGIQSPSGKETQESPEELVNEV
jgi:hypothetical protein